LVASYLLGLLSHAIRDALLEAFEILEDKSLFF